MNEEFPLVIFIEATTDKGEDGNPVVVKNGQETMAIGVFDGLGGRSAGYGDFTGGQIASGFASHLTQNFLEQTHQNLSEQDAIQIQQTICQSLKKEADEKIKPSRIKGTLVSDRLCTTLAIASISPFNIQNNSFHLNLAWIGDSRIYFLSPSKGLQQLTKDDLTEDNDAFELIRKDPPMSQYITADMHLHPDWQINFKVEEFTEKGCVLACTDGCFQYLESPWNFEKLILDTLVRSQSVVSWKNLLKAEYENIKQDDISFVLQPIGINDFDSLKNLYLERLEQIKKNFDTQSNSYDELKKLWNIYSENYEERLATPDKIISDSSDEVVDINSRSQESQSLDTSSRETTGDNLDLGQEVNSDSLSVAHKSDTNSQQSSLEEERLKLVRDPQYSEQIKRLLENANIHTKNKYWDEVIRVYEKILEFQTENLYPQHEIGLAYFELGKCHARFYPCHNSINQYKEAERWLKKTFDAAIEKNILIPIETKEIFAFVLEITGKNDEAITICKEIIKIDSNQPFAFEVIGRISAKQKLYKEALKYKNKAISLHEKQVDYLQHKQRIFDLKKSCDDITRQINRSY